MLLAALDSESEAPIAAQIRSTVTALLAASAPTRPGYWVRLLAAVALAAGPTAVSAAQGPSAGALGSVRLGWKPCFVHTIHSHPAAQWRPCSAATALHGYKYGSGIKAAHCSPPPHSQDGVWPHRTYGGVLVLFVLQAPQPSGQTHQRRMTTKKASSSRAPTAPKQQQRQELPRQPKQLPAVAAAQRRLQLRWLLPWQSCRRRRACALGCLLLSCCCRCLWPWGLTAGTGTRSPSTRTRQGRWRRQVSRVNQGLLSRHQRQCCFCADQA